jgi:hypothetical protein
MRTKFLLAGFTLTVLLTGGPAFAADPKLLNLVMPDATSLAGVNVTVAEITPFGQFVLGQINSAAGPQFQAFVTGSGFDPRHDVTEILAASSSSGTAKSGLVLALGNFPVTQLTAALAQKSALVQNYGGATLIAGPDGNGAIAFIGTTVAVAGDIASVKAAIDRSTALNAINPALNVQVQALSATEDVWAVSTVPVSSFAPALNGGASALPAQIAGILNGIQASSGGVKFGSTVQFTGQVVMKDAATAKSLADVLQALVSMAAMSGPQNPQMASLGQLLQGFTVSASDTAINLALGIPESQIETLLKGMKNQAAPAVRRGIKPAIQPAPSATPPNVVN